MVDVERLRFDAFELDLASGDLKKDGRPVKLSRQPSQLLVLLVQNAGSIIAREQIQKTLWPDGTVVDYDQSINFCVKRIRKSLGDDPSHPRYVETVPRKGYRFLGVPQAIPASERRRWASRRRWRREFWALAPAAGVMAAWALWLVAYSRGTDQVTRTSVVLTRDENPWRSSLDISPDGTRIVYSATYSGARKLFLRRLEDRVATPIRGTEGGLRAFFSPDGEWVGFFEGGFLKKVRLDDVGVVTLAESGTAGGSWERGGHIVFPATRRSGLVKVSVDGGATETLTTLDLNQNELSHRWPHVLPNGNVLFTTYSGGGFDEATIHAVSASTGERRFITRGTYPRYVSTGHLLYGRERTLYAVPFDPDRLELRGNAVPVQIGVWRQITGEYLFAVSETGTLVYRPTFPADRRLMLTDLEGRVQILAAPPKPYRTVRFSPDGGELVTITENGEVYRYELAHERLSRLFTSIKDTTGTVWTLSESDGGDVAWSADGTHLAVSASAPGTGLGSEILIVPLGPAGTAESVASSPASQRRPIWSRDGTRMLYTQQNADYSYYVWEIPLEPAGDPRNVVRGVDPSLSPDGRWLAYCSWQPIGTEEEAQIFVKPLDGPGRGRQISIDGGYGPIWAPDGRTIYYRNGERMMAVEVDTGAAVAAGTPRVVYESVQFLYEDHQSRRYDLSPDGRQFVMIEKEEEPGVTEIRIVQNWFHELNRLAPTN